MEKQKSNIELESSKKLSILVSQDGLSFYFSNSKEKGSPENLHTPFERTFTPDSILEKLKSEWDSNKTKFETADEVIVIYANDLYTLVPTPYFDENNLSDYLKFNTKILENDFIAFDKVKPLSLSNVYIPYANINNYLLDVFGEFNYVHSSTILTQQLVKSAQEKGVEVFAHLGQRHFDLVIVKNKKLLLCNTFAYETAVDFLYYVLFTTQQLRLNPEVFKFNLIGNITEDSKLFKLAYRYIRNCNLYNKNQQTTGDYLLKNSFECV